MSSRAAGEKATAGQPLFSVSNHHTEKCGEPPVIDGNAPGKYVGYFVNEHSEQAIYTYDFETGEATLKMGDAGWQFTYAVVNGEVVPIPAIAITRSGRWRSVVPEHRDHPVR